MVKIDIKQIDAILKELKGLRVKEATSLRKRLQKEREKISIVKPTKIIITKSQRMILANLKRSKFMKGVWNYIKLLRDTYPQLREQHTPREMFSQFFKRRRGKEVQIGEVFWQNPSL